VRELGCILAGPFRGNVTRARRGLADLEYAPVLQRHHVHAGVGRIVKAQLVEWADRERKIQDASELLTIYQIDTQVMHYPIWLNVFEPIAK
jgi:hypothetical protein